VAKGYVILTEAVKDPEGMKAYGQAAGAAMGGVNVLAVDTAPKVVEGSWQSDFLSNILRWIAEERLNLAVERPAAICWITGLPTAPVTGTTTKAAAKK
jgi:hypothetical protein